MTPQLVTAPTRYPVTLSEMREHLRIDAGDHDAILAGYLAAAVRTVEDLSGTAMMQRTYKLFLDDWPRLYGSIEPALRLPMPPLVSVTHVKTYDDLDAATTWSAADYFVDTAGGRIGLRASGSWPIPTRPVNGIEVQWVAGYEDAGSTPENLRQAIVLLTSHWFKNREPVNIGNITSTLPYGVDALVGLSTDWRL